VQSEPRALVDKPLRPPLRFRVDVVSTRPCKVPGSPSSCPHALAPDRAKNDRKSSDFLIGLTSLPDVLRATVHIARLVPRQLMHVTTSSRPAQSFIVCPLVIDKEPRHAQVHR
jgi:hypothetical protein